jgi:hypothetical protein
MADQGSHCLCTSTHRRTDVQSYRCPAGSNWPCNPAMRATPPTRGKLLQLHLHLRPQKPATCCFALRAAWTRNWELLPSQASIQDRSLRRSNTPLTPSLLPQIHLFTSILVLQNLCALDYISRQCFIANQRLFLKQKKSEYVRFDVRNIRFVIFQFYGIKMHTTHKSRHAKSQQQMCSCVHVFICHMCACVHMSYVFIITIRSSVTYECNYLMNMNRGKKAVEHVICVQLLFICDEVIDHSGLSSYWI